MAEQATLERECDVFARYLGASAGDSYVKAQYVAAHAAGVVELAETSAFQRRVVSLASSAPWSLRALDVHSRVFANGGCHEGDMFADFDRVSCDHCCTFFPAVGSVLVRGGYTIRFQSQCDVKEPNLYACANGPIRYDRLGSLRLHPTLSLHHVCCVLANA